jgi:hypothetical protein
MERVAYVSGTSQSVINEESHENISFIRYISRLQAECCNSIYEMVTREQLIHIILRKQKAAMSYVSSM